MTRKHYREMAEILHQELMAFPPQSQYVVSAIAQSLARMFKRDNSAFDSQRFYEACGLDEYGRAV